MSKNMDGIENASGSKEFLRFTFSMCFFTLALLLISFFSLMCGQYQISVTETLSILLKTSIGGAEPTQTMERVILHIRLPRILLAMLAGAGLSISGTAFQGLFANPLATPDTLGVSAGASFGAALGILLGLNAFGIQMMALILGLVAVACVYFISSGKEQASMVMIVLSGLVISALFQAFVSLIKYVADPQDQLPAITYWLMGSLSAASYDKLKVGSPLIFLGIIVIYLLRWKINALTLAEDEARALGIPVVKIRTLIILSATLVTASVISMCGLISWIGLLVPHISRMLFGSDHKYVVPSSLLLGSIIMVIIDTLARTITTAEIPVSILTAIIGAPVFVILLRKTGGIRE